jgi:hypothetical protein
MFIGHYSAAFAAATQPKAPRLGTLFVAAQLVDFGFFGLLLTGAEKMRLTPGISVMNPMDLYQMPLTHSLLGSLVWAAGFALILRSWLGNWTAGWIGAAVVLSHWSLDLLVHVPDLTLAGSAPKFGLGLWNHPAIEMPLEIGLTLAAAWLYARATTGKLLPLGMLLSVLLGLQAYNWFAPAPRSVDAMTSVMAYVGFGVATALAWWVGRGRALRI